MTTKLKKQLRGLSASKDMTVRYAALRALCAPAIAANQNRPKGMHPDVKRSFAEALGVVVPKKKLAAMIALQYALEVLQERKVRWWERWFRRGDATTAKNAFRKVAVVAGAAAVAAVMAMPAGAQTAKAPGLKHREPAVAVAGEKREVVTAKAQPSASPAPLSTAEKVALSSLAEKIQAEQKVLQDLVGTVRQIEADIAAARPGYHLDEATGAIVKDPDHIGLDAKPVTPTPAAK